MGTTDPSLAARSLRTGKELQLLIAAAEDLPTTLAPLRTRRLRRQARLAASVGGATSAIMGGALIAANLGFWASLGTALGLGSIPLLVTLAGAGSLALGLPRRRSRGPATYERQRAQVELTFCCFQLMAEADGRISEEERVLLQSVLLQFPLANADRQALQERQAAEVLAGAPDLEEGIRRQVLQGAWMLAESDGVSPEEEDCFTELAERLGLSGEALAMKRASRDFQAQVNDLVTAMFRTCQQVLAPVLGQPAANDFLESLAGIAATPGARRSLRNSLRGGFSAGGVARTLAGHGQVSKLVAQAGNALRAVFAAAPRELKEGRGRLLELADGTSLGRRPARKICADIDALFDEALAAAGQAASPPAA